MRELEGSAPESVFDARTVAGQFWLPTNPAKKVGGLIRFRQGESITIELLGDLQTKSHAFSGGEHPRVVRGISVNGEPVTAFGVLKASSRLSSLGEIPELHANAVLFGAHLDSLEEAQFTGATASLTSLAPWCEDRLFSVPELETPSRFATIQAAQPSGFDVEVPSIGARVSVSGGVGTWLSSEEARLTFSPRVSVRPMEPKPLSWFDQVLGDFRDLVAVCTFSPVLLESLLMSQSTDKVHRLGVHRAVWFRDRLPPLPPHRMPIRLEDLRPDIDGVLTRWFELTSKARPAIDLFLSVVYRGIHLNTFSFLALAQAAEAFHRLTMDDTFEPVETYSRHYRSIIASLPEDLPAALRDRLKETLKYGNEVSLRSRLRTLCRQVEPLPGPFRSDANSAIAEIVDMRNALTHSTGGDARAIDWQRLNRCVRYLQILLMSHFMRFIGLSDRLIHSRLHDLGHSLRFLGQP